MNKLRDLVERMSQGAAVKKGKVYISKSGRFTKEGDLDGGFYFSIFRLGDLPSGVDCGVASEAYLELVTVSSGQSIRPSLLGKDILRGEIYAFVAKEIVLIKIHYHGNNQKWRLSIEKLSVPDNEISRETILSKDIVFGENARVPGEFSLAISEGVKFLADKKNRQVIVLH